jgi:hypothetical protein
VVAHNTAVLLDIIRSPNPFNFLLFCSQCATAITPYQLCPHPLPLIPRPTKIKYARVRARCGCSLIWKRGGNPGEFCEGKNYLNVLQSRSMNESPRVLLLWRCNDPICCCLLGLNLCLSDNIGLVNGSLYDLLFFRI